MDKLFYIIVLGIILGIALSSFYIWKKSSSKQEFMFSITLVSGIILFIGFVLYEQSKGFLLLSQEEITIEKYKHINSIKIELENAKLKKEVSKYEATSKKKSNYIDVFLSGDYSTINVYLTIEEINELSNLIKSAMEDNKIDRNEYNSLLSVINKYRNLSDTRKVDELKQNIKQN